MFVVSSWVSYISDCNSFLKFIHLVVGWGGWGFLGLRDCTDYLVKLNCCLSSVQCIFLLWELLGGDALFMSPGSARSFF